MGYTHYWEFSPDSAKEAQTQFEIVRAEIKPFIENASKLPERIKLCGGNGKGKPTIGLANVCFNGDGARGLDHETFYFPFDGTPIEFAFCKTARKPYDFIVCLCLLSLRNHVTGFSFSSDGDMDDWKPALDYYRSVVSNVKFTDEEFFEK